MNFQQRINDMYQQCWADEDKTPDVRAQQYWGWLQDGNCELVTYSGSDKQEGIQQLLAIIERLGGKVFDNPEWAGTSECSYVIQLPEHVACEEMV